MKRNRFRARPARAFCLAIAGMLFGLLGVPVARAQINSNAATVNLSATLPESLTVSATPSTVNFTLAASGVSTGSAQISITSAWALSNTRTNVALYAFCSSASAALTDGSGDDIPSANVSGSADSGSFTAFSGNSPFGTGTSVTIFSQSVSGSSLNTSRTDTLDLEIDTTGLNLPVATYTGVLTIRAQAM